MDVHVKLYATLRKFAPQEVDIGESFKVSLQNPTLKGLIEYFGFRESEAKIIMINGIRIDDLNHKLHEDDLIVIFPPVGGG